MKSNPEFLKSFEAVVFDMDGTLIDSIPFHQEAWLRFLGNHGIHLLPEDFHAQNHGTLNEMIFRFFPHEKSREKRLELGEEKEVTFRTIYKSDLKEIEGLTEFLEFLKSKGKSIHLATMGDQNNIDFTLDGLGIRHFFDTITGGHEVLKGKPDPEIFLKSLGKSGQKPENALVFEDSGGGIRSTKAAGIRVFGIASSHTKRELLEMGCQEAFSDFKEVKAWFTN
ncbi:HAD superfamily hydrolase (TIGR01509 family) [Algoriphagus boseongensis]|uniref:HAD superfamily hydrolase (TIGR01509 family) n=1 Tax=Algoriphagus boseongensis TaxID=1442587 RepID=A0A4R6T2P7_9BACT|nr:HAD family phosphatase [Algoriphagus boseongensis]TDQ16414.1 HAD superfamily hydrolase (TIGR01509 family) [Algoriphagus boseongensis]